MRKYEREFFIGRSALKGSVEFVMPNQFITEIRRDFKGNYFAEISVNDESLESVGQSIIQNNILYRDAVSQGIITKDYLSKNILNKIKKLKGRKQIRKLEKLVVGHCYGIYYNLQKDAKYFLDFDEELFLGKAESNSVIFLPGATYNYNGARIINIPNNLFIILKDGKVEVNMDPDFLKEASENFRYIQNIKGIRPIYVAKEPLDNLAYACFTGRNKRKNEIIKGLIEQFIKNGN